MKAVGIDLGTSKSAVAVLNGNKLVMIPNAQGYFTPSIVAYDKNAGHYMVGEVAKRQMILNPETTFCPIKELIRCTSHDVLKIKEQLTYTIDSVKESIFKETLFRNVQAQIAILNPIRLMAHIFRKLSLDASNYLGGECTEAVVAIPSHFDFLQRQAIKYAASIAGLEILRFIHSTSAATLTYGILSGYDEPVEKIIVGDLGGSTYSLSILEIGGGVYEVKRTYGNSHWGGEDFDQRLVDWLASEFKDDHGIDLRTDIVAMQRLREAAEETRIRLSSSNETDINISFFISGSPGPLQLSTGLTRREFEFLVRDLIESLEPSIDKLLSEAELTRNSIGCRSFETTPIAALQLQAVNA